jgi:hypothetical protein
MKLLTKVRSVFPSKGPAGWGWEWGSTTHPVIGHAIVAVPFAFLATLYMDAAGAFWLASIYGGVGTVLIAAAFQEWSDERSSKKIAHHFLAHEAPKRWDDETAVEAEHRERHEVWGGWDWKDFVGFAIGAQVGSLLAVLIY